MSQEKPIKIVLLGDSNVGKTCLFFRIAEETYNPYPYATIGIDYIDKTVCIDDDEVKIQIWDTPGHNRFNSVTEILTRNADGVMLIYDVTGSYSLEGVDDWINKLVRSSLEGLVMVLVGNKCDNEDGREVSSDKGENIALMHGMSFFEISSHENKNVEEALLHLVREIHLKKGDQNRIKLLHTKNQSFLGRNCY